MRDILAELNRLLGEHQPCQWKQVGPCIYCADHDVLLYQGSLPTDRRPECKEHDWDEMAGQGFYMQCRICGEREWFEED